MDLDDILEQWSQDCEIEHKLDEASRNTPKLHSKYLGYLIQAKFLLKRTEDKQNVLLKKKWLWFNGKMSQEEISFLKWADDPFDGLKVMKGDLKYYADSDPEIIDSESKVFYYKTMIESLKDIVDTLKWRHQTIKNMIEARKFEAGV